MTLLSTLLFAFLFCANSMCPTFDECHRHPVWPDGYIIPYCLWSFTTMKIYPVAYFFPNKHSQKSCYRLPTFCQSVEILLNLVTLLEPLSLPLFACVLRNLLSPIRLEMSWRLLVQPSGQRCHSRGFGQSTRFKLKSSFTHLKRNLGLGCVFDMGDFLGHFMVYFRSFRTAEQFYNKFYVILSI